MMTVHVCRVDYSPETGAIVACTCGYAVGPFMRRAHAVAIAREHRHAHENPTKHRR